MERLFFFNELGGINFEYVMIIEPVVFPLPTAYTTAR